MFLTKSKGKLKMSEAGVREIAQQIRALAEDQVSVPRAHMVDYNYL